MQMNSQELETVRRLNLPIKLFVLDNQGYGSIRSTQQAHFAGHFVGSTRDSGLTLPSTLKLAAAYDLPAMEICDHAHVREQVRDVLDRPGPMVCNVRITPNQTTRRGSVRAAGPTVRWNRPHGRPLALPRSGRFPASDVHSTLEFLTRPIRYFS